MKSQTNRSRKRKGFLALSTCLLLFSCEQPLYENYEQIQNAVWEKNKEFLFAFEITDTTALYDITLEVRNNNIYPYRNLWLFSEEKFPDGSIMRDTTEYKLADENGKWNGQGFSVFQQSFPFRANYSFPQGGEYSFTFLQGMRRDELKGIQAIGLRVEKKGIK